MIVLNGYTAVIIAKTMPVFIHECELGPSSHHLQSKPADMQVISRSKYDSQHHIQHSKKREKVQITKSELKDK